MLWSWNDDAAPVTLVAKHTRSASVAAPSPDGTLLATVGADGQLWIWDVRTGQRQFQVQAHNSDIMASPSPVMAARWSQAVPTTQPASGTPGAPRPSRSCAWHDAPITSVAFSDDGKLVVTGATDGTVGLWDVGTGRSLFLASVHGDYVNDVELLADGRVVSAGDDALVRVFECDSCGPIERALGADREHARGHPAPLPFAASETSTIVDVVAGTCLSRMDEEEFTSVSEVPCTEPHASEVYAVFDLPDGPDVEYADDIDDTTDEMCRETYFESFVGIPADESIYPTFANPPTKSSWDNG